MHIGVLTTSFPRWDGDIAGSFVLGLCRALAMRGHTFDVLAPEPAEVIPAPQWPQIAVHFVPYLRPRSAARTFYGAGVPDNLRSDPRAWLGLLPFTASLARATKRHTPHWDALISHWALPCGVVGSALGRRIPHVAVFHSADLHLLERLPLRYALATLVARKASDLVFVSAAHRARFLNLLPRSLATFAAQRAHVQPMGVDLPSNGPRVPSSRTRPFTLLTLARLVPIKGLVPAIQAIAHRDDLVWRIAGDGPEARRIRTLANSAGLRVELLGTLTGSAKAACLRDADAFVLPSRVLPSGRSEGMPTALLEAMAHGLPTITTASGGIPEFVRDGDNGLIYDPSVPGSLEACIDRIRNEPALGRLLSRNGALAAEQYSWPRVALKFEALLRPQEPA